MFKKALILFTIAIIALTLAACSAQAATPQPTAMQEPWMQGQEPAGMDGAVSTGAALPQTAVDNPIPDIAPQGPDTAVCSSTDPAAGLMEVTGVVKDQKQGLILLSLTGGGGDYMLRISENTKWAPGVDKTVKLGNCMTARVKPEPTFAPPSQGEVFLVVKNG